MIALILFVYQTNDCVCSYTKKKEAVRKKEANDATTSSWIDSKGNGCLLFEKEASFFKKEAAASLETSVKKYLDSEDEGNSLLFEKNN